MSSAMPFSNAAKEGSLNKAFQSKFKALSPDLQKLVRTWAGFNFMSGILEDKFNDACEKSTGDSGHGTEAKIDGKLMKKINTLDIAIVAMVELKFLKKMPDNKFCADFMELPPESDCTFENLSRLLGEAEGIIAELKRSVLTPSD